MVEWLNIHNDRTVLNLSCVSVHLSRIHHEAAVIAAGSSHQPFPKDTLNALGENLEEIDPGRVRKEIPEQASSRAGKQPLVGSLQVVKVDGFLSMAPVDMAKDV